MEGQVQTEGDKETECKHRERMRKRRKERGGEGGGVSGEVPGHCHLFLKTMTHYFSGPNELCSTLGLKAARREGGEEKRCRSKEKAE